MAYALQIDQAKNIRGISDPFDLIREGHAFAEKILGEPLTTRMLRAFGGAAQIDKIPKDRLFSCAAVFARFCNPDLKPRAPITDKPVQARNQLEADVAKLKFAEAKRQRVAKATELFDIMRGYNFYWFLDDELAHFAHKFDSLKSDADRLKLYGSSREVSKAVDTRKKYAAVIADYDRQFARDNPGYETFAEYIRSGLIVSTFGTWERPCTLGLKQLQFILTGKE